MGRTAYTGLFSEPKEKDEEISLKALDRVGMARYADMPYTQLSGGEIKLTLLARALGQQAGIIIMDEPTAHLDLRNELLFLETVCDLVKREGISVLIATHSPSHAFYFEGKGLPVRAALMRSGGEMFCGNPQDVLTEENIGEAFGIVTRLREETDRDGNLIRTITPLGTI
jgi:iron complex transport system ATP-binding protein